LVIDANRTFTYTAADGSKIDFSSAGLQTDWVSTDGFASIGYTYSGTTLTGETAVDGQTSTFSTGSIVVGSRTWTLTQTAAT